MTSFKRKSSDISTTNYPCESLPDDIHDYILSFLPTKAFFSLKVLSLDCLAKFDGPYYWRMLTLQILHDIARSLLPSIGKITEEEINCWDTERLLKGCEKYSEYSGTE
jgi:hypothetical protein